MSLQILATELAKKGRGPDSMLVHMSPKEVSGLQSLAHSKGGSLTINPHTGLPEAGFLDEALGGLNKLTGGLAAPILGAGISYFSGGTIDPMTAAGIVGGVTGLSSGNLSQGLMAGLGAYGGASLTGSLANAGTSKSVTDAYTAAGGAGGGETAAQAAAEAAAKNPMSVANLGAGAQAAWANPKDFLKDNAMGLGALGMGLAGGADTQQQMPQGGLQNPGYIRPFSYDPKTGQYTAKTPVRANDWNARGFANGGEVRMAEGGATPGGDGSMAIYDYLMGKGPNPYTQQQQTAAQTPTTPPVTPPVTPPAIPATTENLLGTGKAPAGGAHGSGSTLVNDGSGMGGATSNFTDSQWSTIKDIRNEFGWNNPVDMGSLKAAGNLAASPYTGIAGLASGAINPNLAIKAYVDQYAQEHMLPAQVAEEARIHDILSGKTDPSNGWTPGGELSPGQLAGGSSQMGPGPTPTGGSDSFTSRGIGVSPGGDTGDSSVGNASTAAQAAAAQTTQGTYGGYTTGSTTNSGGDGGDGGGGGGGGGGNAVGGYYKDGHFNQPAMARGGSTQRFYDHSGKFQMGAPKVYAVGGIAALAQGGQPEGHLGSYSDGGRLLKGPGDGVSDDIPATIGHGQPARLADGEFVIPARIVSELGNGSTDAGARVLYQMMARVQAGRKKSIGKDRVAVNSRAAKHLPA